MNGLVDSSLFGILLSLQEYYEESMNLAASETQSKTFLRNQQKIITIKMLNKFRSNFNMVYNEKINQLPSATQMLLHRNVFTIVTV
jgi:hypothetical protein